MTNQPDHHSEKQRVALVSLAASAGLTVIKFVAALFSGSLGLLSEAIHSLIDFGATALTWFAIKWADQPADEDHHFGHAKIESVAALVETLLLFATAIYIAYEAIKHLLTTHAAIDVQWWAIAVILASIAIDYNRSRALRLTAAKTYSDALAADAAHFQSDMWSSGAVLLGLIGVMAGLDWADSVAALIVSIFIAVIGYTLGKRTLATLLDTAPEGVTAAIREIAENANGVLSINQLRVKASGPALFISLVVDVSRMVPVAELNVLKETLSSAILRAYPRADVTVSSNLVPLDTETAFEKIALISHQRSLAVHHLLVQDIDGRMAVSFDLEIEGGSSLESAHAQATELENAIRTGLGGDVEVESHIEPLPLRLLVGRAADAKVAALVEKQLRALAKSEKHLSDLHNIRVRLTEGGLFVHYHCRFAPEQTIDTVHGVVDRIENTLKAKITNIHRVVAHAEPIGHKPHGL